jgi:hypothetical protein
LSLVGKGGSVAVYAMRFEAFSLMTAIFSPAQCVGYVAFVLGVTAFLQRHDRRLKWFSGCQTLAYALHFFLLGNPAAASSSLLSSMRSFIAIRYRSMWLVVVIITLNVAIGAAVVRTPFGWLPVIGACIGTYSVLRLQGLTMRMMLFVGTILWLTNNILSGSIGGTGLEAFIGVANLSTMARMLRERRAELASGSAPD